jgi:hypothetical protein
MSYSSFTLKTVKQAFKLTTIENKSLFKQVPAQDISEHLKITLERNIPLALSINTEKARSELIIINILLEIKQLFPQSSLFSGIEFMVDKEKGLTGFCDYIISRSSEQLYLDAPVIAVVEAKNENMISGMGQCVAEMVAAKLYNEQEKKPLDIIYGVVTTGDEWRFIKLEDSNVFIDQDSYFISQPEKIVAIMLEMLRDNAK